MSSLGCSVGDQNINWEKDDLIFIPIFWGPAEVGHFALLVVDRVDTVHWGGQVLDGSNQ
jgi:hypothetical protein